MTITRREFLGTVGAGVGCTAVTGCGSPRSLENDRPAPDQHTSVPGGDRWKLAEAAQVPINLDVARNGHICTTLLRLASGDWIIAGLAPPDGYRPPATLQASRKPYWNRGAAPSGGDGPPAILQVWLLRSADIRGPWQRVARIGGPTKEGAHWPFISRPHHLVQLRSGRLLLPANDPKVKSSFRVMFSDDEGQTWDVGPALSQTVGVPRVEQDLGQIKECQDGSLVMAVYIPAGPKDWVPGSQGIVRSTDGGQSWGQLSIFGQYTPEEGIWYREGDVAVLQDGQWLAACRIEDETIDHNKHHGPTGMAQIVTMRSSDQGQTWSAPRLALLGVEGVIAVLPGGAVVYTMREQNAHTLWVSYDHGDSWECQMEPCAMPWEAEASVKHGQFPPGGTPGIQVLDERTAVAITRTGIAPRGTSSVGPTDPDSEYQGWIHARFLRRTVG